MRSILCAVTILLFACDQSNNGITPESRRDSIAGSWLLVEYGYSPGSGYITNPVPAVPPQWLTMEMDGSFASNIEALKIYRYYGLVDDKVSAEKVLALFESDPGEVLPDLADLHPTYTVKEEGTRLTLSYRWCIEGCHMTFRPVDLELDDSILPVQD